MPSSVDGLVSGLSTSSMITQMMQVEAAPQNKLKTKAENALTAVAAYQTINIKMKAAKSAAGTLVQLETWRALKAKSSSESVTATATGDIGGMAGSLKFNVTAVAKAQSTVLRVNTVADDALPSSIDIKLGKYDANGDLQQVGDIKTITLEGVPLPKPTPENLAAAVNKANLGIRAYVVKTNGDEGVLQFTGAKSGAANGFEIDFKGFDLKDPATGLPTVPGTTKSTDAVIVVNPGGDSAYTAVSSTNTFATLMPGVSLTVSKEQDGVTIDAVSDPSAIADKLKAFVDATNEALTEIKAQTAYNVDSRKGSTLTGDFAVRQMTQALLGEISAGLSTKKTLDAKGKVVTEPYDFGDQGASLSRLGISLSKDGTQLAFDPVMFNKAYAKDPVKTQEAGIVFGGNLKITTDKQSNTLIGVMTGRKSEVDSLSTRIDDWDVRLSSRKQALQRQYAALETALGKLNNQSSWLSGQIGSLG